MVKKLETGLTTEFTTLPWPTLRLAYCPPHHAYSTPREGGADGGGQTHGLEDLAGIHHGNSRSGIAATQRVPGDGEPHSAQPAQGAYPVE